MKKESEFCDAHHILQHFEKKLNIEIKIFLEAK